MFAQMMNDGMMSSPMMAVCMIGGTLLIVVFLVIPIVQTVLQNRILTELRELKKRKSDGN